MPKKRKTNKSNVPGVLIVAGLFFLVAVVLLLKDKPQAEAVSAEDPAVQLEQALESRQPTLAFYHSTDCHQCAVMMDIMAQVYPEFDKSITLVDVNVYEERNIPLLQEVGLQYIPTLMFYNAAGERTVHVGVMEADTLHTVLASLEGDQ